MEWILYGTALAGMAYVASGYKEYDPAMFEDDGSESTMRRDMLTVNGYYPVEYFTDISDYITHPDFYNNLNNAQVNRDLGQYGIPRVGIKSNPTSPVIFLSRTDNLQY